MQQTKIMRDGHAIPLLGFGVYQIPPEETKAAILAALNAGYRHIDTAQVYLNEREVGEALQETELNREEIFVTTKLWVQDVEAGKARQSILASLERMKLDYLDLVLIHQPYHDVYGAWRDLIQLQKEGKIRSIGVSNFAPDKLVDLGVFTGVMPAVNQIEVNPFHQQLNRLPILEEEGVVVEAWAPFAEGRHQIFSHPTLVAVADKHQKTVAQVIIRYFIEQELVVLTKTIRPDRMAENLNVFDFSLDAEDRVAILAMDLSEDRLVDHSSPDRIRRMAAYKITLEN